MSIPGSTTQPAEEFEYAGFWVRVGASLIDTVLVLVITVPILWALFGGPFAAEPRTDLLATAANILISYVAPAVAVIIFWIARQATPGKMAVRARVVDALTGNPVTVPQAIVRYLGYFVSTIPLCLDDAIRDGRLTRGKLTCLVAFGAGFTWSSMLVRW